MCKRERVGYQPILETNNGKKFKFIIQNIHHNHLYNHLIITMCRWYWNFLRRSVRWSVYRVAQKNSNTLRLYERNFFLCILTCLNCSKSNEMNNCLSLLKNMFPTEYGINTVQNLLTGPHKKIRIYLWICLVIIKHLCKRSGGREWRVWEIAFFFFLLKSSCYLNK